MEELAGGVVTDANLHSGFVWEIHNGRDARLLTFKVYSQPNVSHHPPIATRTTTFNRSCANRARRVGF